MLQKNTVEKTAFELLRTLMQDSQMDQFFLVGGTSIALRLGHRKSIDLDLFTQNDIDFIHEPVNLIVGKFNWEHIEKRLYDMIKNPQEIYTTYPI
ncbi:nucleotidyl transferase AbiEii/AbiGii toxin family protein [Treponema denticola]